jgi:hypothetical protein
MNYPCEVNIQWSTNKEPKFCEIGLIDPCYSTRRVLDSPFAVGTCQSFQILDSYKGACGTH